MQPTRLPRYANPRVKVVIAGGPKRCAHAGVSWVNQSSRCVGKYPAMLSSVECTTLSCKYGRRQVRVPAHTRRDGQIRQDSKLILDKWTYLPSTQSLDEEIPLCEV